MHDVTSNQTITAIWNDPGYHTVTWNLAGGAWPSSFDPQLTVADGGTIAEPAEDPVRTDGYTFAGWDITVWPITDVQGQTTITAQWDPPIHTITWDLDGGDWTGGFTPQADVADGGTIDLPTQIPVHPGGNTFNRWSVVLPMHDVTSNQTIIAIWNDPGYHTVTWNLAGGAWPSSFDPQLTVTDGGTITLPTENPTRDSGYTFNRWDVSLPMADVDSERTITAIWNEPGFHTVRWDLDGGAWPGSFVPVLTIADNGQILEPEEPSRPGYSFDGWDVTFPLPVTQETVITASWIPHHTITWNLGVGGVWPSGFAPQLTVAPGGTINVPAQNPDRPGFVFGGWDTGFPIDDVTSNQTITALWNELPPAFVRVRFMGNGGAPAQQDVYNVQVGGTYALAIANIQTPTRAGHQFAGWFTAQTGGTLVLGTTVVTNTSDHNLYARWTPTGGGGGGGGGITPPPIDPGYPDYDGMRHAFLMGSGGQIRPHSNITRAEVATIFFRLISDADRAFYWSQVNPFPDVPQNNWFNNAVSTSTHMGIFQGLRDGTFAPNQTITRAELAAVTARFLGMPSSASTTDRFNDVSDHWARNYINWLGANGWVQGSQGIGGAFNPDTPITRAETAAMINRIFNRVPGSVNDLLPDMLTWSDNANVGSWYFLYIQSATNSFTYTREGGNMTWVTIRPARDWTVLERPYSNPNMIHQATVETMETEEAEVAEPTEPGYPEEAEMSEEAPEAPETVA